MVVNCSYELLNARLLHPYILFNVCRKLEAVSLAGKEDRPGGQRLTALPGWISCLCRENLSHMGPPGWPRAWGWGPTMNCFWVTPLMFVVCRVPPGGIA